MSVEPASGRLGAAGSADSTSTITVTLSPLEPAAVVGELAVSTAGMKEPLLQPLGASVVQSSYQIIDSVTKAPVTEVGVRKICVLVLVGVLSNCSLLHHMSLICRIKASSRLPVTGWLKNLGILHAYAPTTMCTHVAAAALLQIAFGELFFGESVSRELTLVNSGPTEVCFDLSFGSTADLKALLATGPDEDVTAADDRLATFLQVARIRVSSWWLAALCACAGMCEVLSVSVR